MFSYLKLDIYQRALIALLLSAYFLPQLGYIMVLEDFTFAATGITHIAFAGASIFLALQLPPLLGTLVFAVLSGLGLWYFSEKRGTKLDASMGMLFAVFMAIAVIALNFASGYSGEAFSYLFGSVLTVSWKEVIMLLCVGIILEIFLWLFHRDLFMILLNRELAKASGVRIEYVNLAYFLILALAITISMKILGALLILGLTVIPAITSLRLSVSFTKGMLLAGFVGFLSGLISFFLSLKLNIPVSPTVILVAFVVYLLSFVKSRT